MRKDPYEIAYLCYTNLGSKQEDRKRIFGVSSYGFVNYRFKRISGNRKGIDFANNAKQE